MLEPILFCLAYFLIPSDTVKGLLFLYCIYKLYFNS